MDYAILGIVGGIFLIAIIWALVAHNKMIASGEIVKRKMNFMEMAEVFTLNTPDPHLVVQKIQQFPVMGKTVGASWNENTQYFEFNHGKSWTASMSMQNADNGKSVYKFGFNSWRKNNGTPEGALDANKLLTSIEKMFLEFDPGTQVRNEAVNYKTKHSFF